MVETLEVFGLGWPAKLPAGDGPATWPGRGLPGGAHRLNFLGGPDGEDPLWQGVQCKAAERGLSLHTTFGTSFREMLGLGRSDRLSVHRPGFFSPEAPHNVFIGTRTEAEERLSGLGPHMGVRLFASVGPGDEQPWGEAAGAWSGFGAVYWAAPWVEGARIAPLVRLMASLRAPGGCPWDREQTPLSLRTYLLEEAAEAVDAITSADKYKIVEELGDLLLQIAFHAEIGREEQSFTLSDITAAVTSKMIRRHPHVFGRAGARTAEEVDVTWQAIKEREGGGQRALLDEVPHSFGAAEEAAKLLKLASRLQLLEAATAGAKGPGAALIRVFADLLATGVDPAVALREANLQLREVLGPAGPGADRSPSHGGKSARNEAGTQL